MKDNSTGAIEYGQPPLASRLGSSGDSLRNRSDEVLLAHATLGLLAIVADGDADSREIEIFSWRFRESFALSRRQSWRFIGAALTRIRNAKDLDIIDSTCDLLNEHLNCSQKVSTFEALAEVLIVDGHVHEGEEIFVDYIVQKLAIAQALQQRYPAGL